MRTAVDLAIIVVNLAYAIVMVCAPQIWVRMLGLVSSVLGGILLGRVIAGWLS